MGPNLTAGRGPSLKLTWVKNTNAGCPLWLAPESSVRGREGTRTGQWVKLQDWMERRLIRDYLDWAEDVTQEPAKHSIDQAWAKYDPGTTCSLLSFWIPLAELKAIMLRVSKWQHSHISHTVFKVISITSLNFKTCCGPRVIKYLPSLDIGSNYVFMTPQITQNLNIAMKTKLDTGNIQIFKNIFYCLMRWFFKLLLMYIIKVPWTHFFSPLRFTKNENCA